MRLPILRKTGEPIFRICFPVWDVLQSFISVSYTHLDVYKRQWYECVMKNSENKEMAQKYVEFMYDHNADYMDLTLKIAGRTSVYEEAGKTEGNEHTTAVLETLGAEQTQARPMVTTWAQIEEVLTGVVESCLGGADIQETLEAARTEIEAIGM